MEAEERKHPNLELYEAIAPLIGLPKNISVERLKIDLQGIHEPRIELSGRITELVGDQKR